MPVPPNAFVSLAPTAVGVPLVVSSGGSVICVGITATTWMLTVGLTDDAYTGGVEGAANDATIVYVPGVENWEDGTVTMAAPVESVVPVSVNTAPPGAVSANVTLWPLIGPAGAAVRTSIELTVCGVLATTVDGIDGAVSAVAATTIAAPLVAVSALSNPLLFVSDDALTLYDAVVVNDPADGNTTVALALPFASVTTVCAEAPLPKFSVTDRPESPTPDGIAVNCAVTVVAAPATPLAAATDICTRWNTVSVVVAETAGVPP
jgi:hypothetical protein